MQDSESSIEQALDAVLISELVDREGWNVLLGVCKRLGRPDLAKRFEIALSRQTMHLQKMRHWYLRRWFRDNILARKPCDY